ncbi:MAG TPA: M28 family peptidase [Planctomycetaceae bacterium]|nr:M28 family peptidase [Planctomycetaceae bacterium]
MSSRFLTTVLLLVACVPALSSAADIDLAKLREGAVDRLSHDVKLLASDEMDGRGPGTEGLDKAAEFIRDEFKKAGLTSAVSDGSFYQPFVVQMGRKPIAERTYLEITGPDDKVWKLEFAKDFQAYFTPGQEEVEAPIVFVGYGISAPDFDYDEYADIDVEGKFVLLIRREPQQDNKESVFDGDKVTAHSYFRAKIKQATDRKAAGILLVNDPFTVKKEERDAFVPQGGVNLAQSKLAFAHLSQGAANQLLEKVPVKAGDTSLTSIASIESHIDGQLKPISQILKGWTVKFRGEFANTTAKTVNVAGVLEGEGPMADETVVVGAHYDHLGYGGYGSRRQGDNSVHNGADDNASGTAALIELARRMTKGDKPRRRVVFIAFSGEERGLLGSRFYAEAPLVPIEKTVAMFNYDMIGNLRDDQLEIHGVGSGSTFDEVLDSFADDHGLKLKKSRPVARSSDHHSFYQKKVPVLFFFTGHTKIYHTPDDDYETLNIPGLARVVNYSEEVIVAMVNADKGPTYQQTGRGVRRRGVPNLGFLPTYKENEGVSVREVRENSPAAIAGLKAGDLIESIAGSKISDVRSMVAALQRTKPGDEVKLVVVRDEKKVELIVKLAKP